MARKIPANRFDDLVRVATEVFIAQGYRRTQMADVATELGLAKGTLYGYVESKEALFDLCLRHADDRDPVPIPAQLPLPTPAPGTLLRMLTTRLQAGGGLPRLSEALGERQPDVRKVRAELEEVLRELYEVLERNHRAIKLIDVCALDHPELAAAWQKGGREAPRDRMADYLASRSRAGLLRPIADASLAARLVIETITTWTVHIRWDRLPQSYDAKAARDNVIEFLVRGLLPSGEDAQ